MSYAVIKIKLRAVIGGVQYTDISEFASSFAVNQIPHAALVVAVGTNVSTGQLATAHANFDKLVVNAPALVYMTATVTSSEGISTQNLGVPNGKEVLIYKGEVVGTGWRRSTNAAQFTIHIAHWLSALDYSSAINSTMHPGNPSAWTFPAVYRLLGPGNAAAAAGATAIGTPGWIPNVTTTLVGPTVTDDVWGNGLWKVLTQVASSTPFDSRLFNAGGAGAGGGISDPAVQDALSHIGPNTDGAPLQLETEGVDAAAIATAIRNGFIQDTGDSWVNTTIWGKLIGDMAPSFLFSVIPRITDAMIVPFTAGLQGKPWATIDSSTYSSSEVNGQMQRVLGAVGILNPVSYVTGINGFLANDTTNRTGCAGFFRPDGVTSGMFMVKDAPSWLRDPSLGSLFSAGSTGGAATAPVATAFDPGIAPANRGAAAGVPQASLQRILSNFAHQWYVIEMLKGRTAEVSGMLRFDICPGSNIELIAEPAKNIAAENDKLVRNLFATVVSVSYLIDAEGQRASTSFSLAHVRDTQENQSEGTSIDKPALYQQAWRGAPLILGSQPTS